MKNTTPTIYGDHLQAVKMFNTPFDMWPFSTLNERLGVLSGQTPAAGKIPSVGWFVIGNQGHRPVINGANSWNTGRQHEPTDGGPFNLLPMVVRDIDNDVTQAERANLALRKIVQGFDGTSKIAYYARRTDTSGLRPAAVIMENGTFRPWAPNDQNLSPTPTDLAPEEATSVSGQQIGIRMVQSIILSASMIEEVVNGCRQLWDNAEMAVLSEICAVSAVEYVTSGQATSGGSVEYTEIIAAQVVAHLVTHYQLTMVNSQVREDLVLGTSNPLFKRID